MNNNKDINPFDKLSGSAVLENPRVILLVLLSVSFIAIILAKLKIAGVGLFLALFFGGVFIYIVFKNPIIGFFTAIAYNFVVLGIGRYITSGLPLGFGIDGLMLLTILALIFSRFRERVDWSPAYRDITILAAVWLGYFILQLGNPEARMIEPWIA